MTADLEKIQSAVLPQLVNNALHSAASKSIILIRVSFFFSFLDFHSACCAQACDRLSGQAGGGHPGQAVRVARGAPA